MHVDRVFLVENQVGQKVILYLCADVVKSKLFYLLTLRIFF